jgi:hypothetical protein
MKSLLEIKIELMVLAGYLADGEALPLVDAELSVQAIVARIFSAKDATEGRMTAVAMCLAQCVDLAGEEA